ncbi:MAG: HesA/MoeB/ThiF family protein [Geopsychrobacter sp.]|nr:HesA/MoeB/ThiF family protein [Geopsychrobacter sp.]
MSVKRFLAEKAEGILLNWADQREMMARFELECCTAEELILQSGYLPTRYQRNQQMISTEQQLQLLQSKVAVVGCGGLGGYILEELARLGVGQIVAIDPDLFEESNLNRQLLSSLKLLGTAKVDAAVARIAEINPVVRVCPIAEAFDKKNGEKMLAAADLVIDAVDNIPARLDLAETCTQMNIPLVHGAIAGWFGQVVTVFPGEQTLQKLYANWSGGKGIEAGLGNPSFTPAVAASLQVAEACKLLLGQGEPLQGKMLSINLLDMQFDEIPL